MSIETLDYTIVFNEHTVTCFEVGSVPTIGYASIEDAMTGTNPVIVPECIFEAACALLDQGVHLTAIYAHVGEETWMQWDEIPEELTAEDIVAIEDEDSIRKQAVNRKQRRARRRVQNKRHKQSDRKHGKSVFSYKYKENGVLKTQILPNNMRSKSAWSKACHEWGDPDGLKGRIPRTQSVNVHKDTKPVPEQEPTYVGFYGTLEVRKGITVTMEWNVPEAVKGEPV